MYRKHLEVLFQVQELARQRNIEYERKSKSESRALGDITLDEMLERDEVYEFLKSQDINTLKVIQTAMYLGRDYYPETAEEAEIRAIHNSENPFDEIPPPLKVNNPEELFDDWFKSSFNTHDESSIANQIAEKMPLDKYLERAPDILGI